MPCDPPNASVDAHALPTAWDARFGRALGAFFRRRGASPADSEDLTQDVFERLARRGGLHDVRAIEGFLFRVAANVLTDWRRRRGARAEGLHDPVSAASEIADPAPTPERVLLGKEAMAALRTALADLPERTRTVFACHHFDGMTYREIAAHCGIAVRTVEDHMARANVALLAAMRHA